MAYTQAGRASIAEEMATPTASPALSLTPVQCQLNFSEAKWRVGQRQHMEDQVGVERDEVA